MTPDWLRYANQGATRSQPISSDLVEALSFLPELGLQMEVFSGGQPAAGEGPRVGSTRHDHGDSADVFFYRNGERLDWSNPDHIPIYQDVVRRARANGVTGFGAGEGYMRPGSMHIGFGNPAVWGAGGSGDNAPDWLREAFNATGTTAPQQSPGLLGRASSGSLVGSPGNDTLGGNMAGSTALDGLLSRLLNREPPAPLSPMAPKERGSLWDRIKSPDTLANLAIGLQGMTIDPNEGFIDAMQSGIERRGDDDRQQRTVEWLAQQPGGADYAAAISAGMSPQEAIGGFMEARQGPSEIEALQMAAAMQGLERGELEINNLRNPQPETTAEIREYEYAKRNGYQGSFEEWKTSRGAAGNNELSLNPIYGVGPNGETVILQTSRTGEVVQAQMPDGVTLSQKPIEVDNGQEVIFLDPLTRQEVARVDKKNREAAAETAAGSAEGKAGEEARQVLPQVRNSAQRAIDLIESIRNDPALESITGTIQGRIPPIGQAGVDLNTKVQQLQGQVFLEAFNQLKGGGVITEVEGLKAEQAMARLNRAQSTEAYQAALDELAGVLRNAIKTAETKAGVAGSQVSSNGPWPVDGPVPEGWDAETWAYVSPEERASILGQ